LISMRTKEALAVRRAEGVILGRRKGSCVKQQMLRQQRLPILKLLQADCSLAEICRTFDVSVKTFHRFRHDDSEIDTAYRSAHSDRISRTKVDFA
ncbi:MAG: invertase, partial [Alistipes sp.]